MPAAPLSRTLPLDFGSSALVAAARPRSIDERDCQLHCGDAVEWLLALEPESLDLIVTDPPYESLEKHRAIGTTTRLKHSKASSNDWFKIFPNERLPQLFIAAYRALRRNTHLYLFCDQETMFLSKPMAEAAGFKFWKPIVWDKRRIGMGYHYRSRYEFILFFEKGKRKLNDLAVPDIIECPRIYHGYPTEKPAQVSEILVRQSSTPGGCVADPFMGSGSVGLAALALGRRFMGNDICDSAMTLARARLLSGVTSHSSLECKSKASTVQERHATSAVVELITPRPLVELMPETAVH